VAIGQVLPNGYMLQTFNKWFIDNQSMQIFILPTMIAVVFIMVLWLINKNLLQRFARI
jgi:hypothetical protein